MRIKDSKNKIKRYFFTLIVLGSVIPIFAITLNAKSNREENLKPLFEETIKELKNNTAGVIVYHPIYIEKEDGTTGTDWDIYKETKNKGLIEELFDVLETSSISHNRPIVTTSKTPNFQLALYDENGNKITILLIPIGDIKKNNKNIYYTANYDKLRETIDKI